MFVIADGTLSMLPIAKYLFVTVTAACRIFMLKKPGLVISDLDLLRELMVKKFAYFPNRVVSL